MRRALPVVLLIAVASWTARTMIADSPLLKRRYSAGESLRYEMSARNQNDSRVISYQARAEGVTRKNASGAFVVDFQWSHLSFNGSAFPLSRASLLFRQTLSLEPAFRLSIPDLSKVQPALIGPIVDLLTFYADTQLPMRQGMLRKQGDHVYVRNGRPNSWADHVHTLIGEDAIDFDVTLKEVDLPAKAATLVVRHVPPVTSTIEFPATWMRTRVADTPNNWVQVQKENGEYVAAVGKEVFTDTIHLNLTDGRIVSATMVNPVEVLEKTCSDAALEKCGNARRYRIERLVEIQNK